MLEMLAKCDLNKKKKKRKALKKKVKLGTALTRRGVARGGQVGTCVPGRKIWRCLEGAKLKVTINIE